jgi:hypothetical protein
MCDRKQLAIARARPCDRRIAPVRRGHRAVALCLHPVGDHTGFDRELISAYYRQPADSRMSHPPGIGRTIPRRMRRLAAESFSIKGLSASSRQRHSCPAIARPAQRPPSTVTHPAPLFFEIERYAPVIPIHQGFH